ncbi:MAG: D-glycero-beta-D-manno-heptose 1-phosphate adenylyltransferase [Bacteroidota bacterium]
MSSIEHILTKVLPGESLATRLALWRFKDKKIVFTNGCFDILHPGHVDYLSRARDLGDLLIIGLNSDASVQRLKGPSRPILDENSRALILASLSFVDAVVLFDEDTPLELISKVQPDILVKGGDYVVSQVVGSDLVFAKGGQVIILPFLDGFSTTSIEKKILSNG